MSVRITKSKGVDGDEIQLTIQDDLFTEAGPEMIVLKLMRDPDEMWVRMTSYPGFSESLYTWPSGRPEEQRRWSDLIREAIFVADSIGSVSVETNIDSPNEYVPANPRWYRNLLAENGFKIRRGFFGKVMVANLRKQPKKKEK